MNKPDMFQRLGFEAWADNLIVNLIEDGKLGDFVIEDSAMSIVVTDGKNGEFNVAVRAYVEGQGWKYHDRIIKKGCQS